MDRSELQSVLALNRGRLLSFLRARALDRSEAEDCLQEMWLRIARASVGSIKDPLPYLYRMADNMVIDRRRLAKRRSEREAAWASGMGIPDDVDPTPTPEQAMLAREQLRSVQAAINRLPPKTVEIFRRFRLEGDSQKEIAREFGVTVSAIEKQLRKAYKAILAAAEEHPIS